MSDNSRDPRLIHVRKPVVCIDLEMQPVEPLDGPIHDGPLIHVRKPLQRLTATFGPPEEYVLKIRVNSNATVDGVVSAINEILHEINQTLGREAGVQFTLDMDSATHEEDVVCLPLKPGTRQEDRVHTQDQDVVFVAIKERVTMLGIAD